MPRSFKTGTPTPLWFLTVLAPRLCNIFGTPQVVPSALSPAAGRNVGGSPISSAAFSPARRVASVHVSSKGGARAVAWPDPLPLLSSDLNATIAPNTTGALWVEISVASNTVPGDYEGSVAVLAAGRFVVRVPIALTVYNFSVAQRSL
eukprot:SAG31_NODE_5343_length_2596_cov_4.210653_1_plen_147_part_10